MPKEDSTRGCLELASHLSSSLPKEGGIYGSYNVYGLRCRKIL